MNFTVFKCLEVFRFPSVVCISKYAVRLNIRRRLGHHVDNGDDFRRTKRSKQQVSILDILSPNSVDSESRH